jgi:endoglucanase
LFKFPSWGSGFRNDWAVAAEKAGNGILSVNPNLLIIVQGIFHLELFDRSYPQTLKHVWKRPIQLNVPDRVVYSTHDYTWQHRYLDFSQNYADDGPEYKRFIATMERRWGKVAEKYPVWIGEFGTWHGTSFDTFWRWMLPYMKSKDVAGFSYWCLDGTQSTATGRSFGAEEGYGLLNMDWSDYASLPHLQSIQALMKDPPI